MTKRFNINNTESINNLIGLIKNTNGVENYQACQTATYVLSRLLDVMEHMMKHTAHFLDESATTNYLTIAQQAQISLIEDFYKDKFLLLCPVIVKELFYTVTQYELFLLGYINIEKVDLTTTYFVMQ